MTERTSARWRMILGGDMGYDSLTDNELCKANILDEVFSPQETRSAQGYASLLRGIHAQFPPKAAMTLQRALLSGSGADRRLHTAEVLGAVRPDPALLARLLARPIPEKARNAVERMAEDVVSELLPRVTDACAQTLAPSSRQSRKPDWEKTIRRNLKNYDASRQKLLLSNIIMAQKRVRSLPLHLIVLVDRSASMADQTLFCAVACAALTALHFISVKLIAFTDKAVDLSDCAPYPVQCLLSLPPCGGTHIGNALRRAETLIQDDGRTVTVLFSDFFDGGDYGSLMDALGRIRDRGVRVYGLCGTGDAGEERHNAVLAAQMGINVHSPAFENWAESLFHIIKNELSDKI